MKNNKTNKVDEIIDAKENLDKDILSDVNGSYTGVPLDGGKPIQDADDL